MSKMIASAALLLITAGAASAEEPHKNWASWESGRPDETPSFSAPGSDHGGSAPQVMAPEIDPASSVAAMTLLIGGMVVLRGRKLRA